MHPKGCIANIGAEVDIREFAARNNTATKHAAFLSPTMTKTSCQESLSSVEPLISINDKHTLLDAQVKRKILEFYVTLLFFLCSMSNVLIILISL